MSPLSSEPEIDERLRYMNARVRSMSAELLGREFYERVLAVEGEELSSRRSWDLPTPLSSARRSRERGNRALESALRRNIFAVYSKLRAFAPERPRRLLNVQFNQWDARTCSRSWRGKAVDAEPEEIMEGVFPVGEFDEAQLSELAPRRTPRPSPTRSRLGTTVSRSVEEGCTRIADSAD